VVEASLARLHELALALPRSGCEWESRPTFDPPATPEAVAAFEMAVGFPLPADLRAFFASTGAVVGMSIHNGYWLGGLDQLTRSAGAGGWPREVAGELVAPIATDGGGNVFLVSSGGRVLRWGRETGNVSEVSASFAEFLERVADDWAAYIADIPGWRFLV
jgi:cell wall assembly regulator SMI1